MFAYMGKGQGEAQLILDVTLKMELYQSSVSRIKAWESIRQRRLSCCSLSCSLQPGSRKADEHLKVAVATSFFSVWPSRQQSRAGISLVYVIFRAEHNAYNTRQKQHKGKDEV